MRLTIDTTSGQLIREAEDGRAVFELYSDEAFELLAQQWLKLAWNQKYTYTFTWLGRPVIQLPDDLFRLQEVIYRLQPDVIVETGIAHGGSLIFHASLCKALDKGRVIGVDVDIRPHNRRALEEHPLFPWITLVEGSSTNPATVAQVKSLIHAGESVLVVLDSAHDRNHVQAELDIYCQLVTPGSYIVATDGIMEALDDAPRGRPDWSWDNPASAAREFASRCPDFVLEQPAWLFNESTLRHNVTHWPSAWLRRQPSPGD